MKQFDFNSISKNELINSLYKLKNSNILVIGDLILDEYIFGDVERISPEAPVPIINAKNRTYHIGGAGNVLRHLKNIGCKYYFISVAGKDQYEKNLNLLLNNYINKDKNNIFIFKDENRKTTRKIRIISQNQQLLRIDWEDTHDIDYEYVQRIIDEISKIIYKLDAIIISDYGKGAITKKLLNFLFKINKNNIPIIVDPKKDDFSFYKNSYCITPNIKESERAVKFKLNDFDDFVRAGKKIIDIANLEYLLMTLSDKGMLLFDRKNNLETRIPVVPVEVSDVTGGGDTAISYFTASIASGNLPEISALISSIASSITVRHLGVYPPSLNEVEEQINLMFS